MTDGGWRRIVRGTVTGEPGKGVFRQDGRRVFERGVLRRPARVSRTNPFPRPRPPFPAMEPPPSVCRTWRVQNSPFLLAAMGNCPHRGQNSPFLPAAMENCPHRGQNSPFLLAAMENCPHRGQDGPLLPAAMGMRRAGDLQLRWKKRIFVRYENDCWKEWFPAGGAVFRDGIAYGRHAVRGPGHGGFAG